MPELMETPGSAVKKKNYPGIKRIPGTKDYALILSNLIKCRNELLRTENPDQIIENILKISLKIQELGFNSYSVKIKSLVKKRINVSYKLRNDRYENLGKKKEITLSLCVEVWKKGKTKHETSKTKSREL